MKNEKHEILKKLIDSFNSVYTNYSVCPIVDYVQDFAIYGIPLNEYDNVKEFLKKHKANKFRKVISNDKKHAILCFNSKKMAND